MTLRVSSEDQRIKQGGKTTILKLNIQHFTPFAALAKDKSGGGDLFNENLHKASKTSFWNSSN